MLLHLGKQLLNLRGQHYQFLVVPAFEEDIGPFELGTQVDFRERWVRLMGQLREIIAEAGLIPEAVQVQVGSLPRAEQVSAWIARVTRHPVRASGFSHE